MTVIIDISDSNTTVWKEPKNKDFCVLRDPPTLICIKQTWDEEPEETRRVSRQNKFVKLVHLIGFIMKESQ